MCSNVLVSPAPSLSPYPAPVLPFGRPCHSCWHQVGNRMNGDKGGNKMAKRKNHFNAWLLFRSLPLSNLPSLYLSLSLSIVAYGGLSFWLLMSFFSAHWPAAQWHTLQENLIILILAFVYRLYFFFS